MQIIMVREPGDSAPDVVEYRHGLTPPMRDARKRRFRREPDLNVQIASILLKRLFIYDLFLLKTGNKTNKRFVPCMRTLISPLNVLLLDICSLNEDAHK